jgi:hypothetical protein
MVKFTDTIIDEHNILSYYGKILKTIEIKELPIHLLSHITIELDDDTTKNIESWQLKEIPKKPKTIPNLHGFDVPKIKYVRTYINLVTLVNEVEEQLDELFFKCGLSYE